MFFFIRPIKDPYLTFNDYCVNCIKLPRCAPLCKVCVEKRNQYGEKVYNNQTRSLEYRIRLWLMNLFNPDNSKRMAVRYVPLLAGRKN